MAAYEFQSSVWLLYVHGPVSSPSLSLDPSLCDHISSEGTLKMPLTHLLDPPASVCFVQAHFPLHPQLMHKSWDKRCPSAFTASSLTQAWRLWFIQPCAVSSESQSTVCRDCRCHPGISCMSVVPRAPHPTPQSVSPSLEKKTLQQRLQSCPDDPSWEKHSIWSSRCLLPCRDGQKQAEAHERLS